MTKQTSELKQSKAEEMSEENDLSVEINQAYIDNVGEEYATGEDCAEAYAGDFDNDEDFTQDLLEQTGTLPKDLPPYIHIDWERTANDIMEDYFEQDGHYFRNL
jgi:antirestriction protein